MELELLTLNAFGSVRPARRDGRPYLVANGTIIVPGVLPGSKGPLYYPEDEVRNSAPLWNGVDIVLRHPTDPRTGLPLSAKSTGVLARVGMGLLQNTTFKGGRLGTELWFDVRNTERLDAGLSLDLRVLPKLRAGQPVELSTGLYTKQRPAPLGAVWNGRSYTAVAVAYRPDHLAVLPDEVGACSIRDGCGVLVNSSGAKLADVAPLRFLDLPPRKMPDLFGVTLNMFCPTGEGGGVDPSCGKGSKPKGPKKMAMSGFPETPGVKGVTKAPDHEYTGTKLVHLETGRIHPIYFDRTTGGYHHANHVNADTSRGLIGFDKEETLKRLVAGDKEGKWVPGGHGAPTSNAKLTRLVLT